MLDKFYVRFIGIGIELLEKFIFNRRLARSYKKIFKRNLYFKDKIYIVDVGANRGQSTKFFSKLFSNHKIYCFEANPNIIKKLKENTKNINRKIFCVALGDESKETSFNICILDAISTLSKPNLKSSYNIFKSRILRTDVRKLYKKVNIKMKLLDSYFQKNQIEAMDILKIDVEGFEYQVIMGSKLIISSLKPKVIQVEAHHSDQYQNYNPNIEILLNSYGYKLERKISHAFGEFLDLIFIPTQ